MICSQVFEKIPDSDSTELKIESVKNVAKLTIISTRKTVIMTVTESLFIIVGLNWKVNTNVGIIQVLSSSVLFE